MRTEYTWNMHEYAWDAQGICLEYVWNMLGIYARSMHGIRMEYAWNMHDSAWAMQEICLEYAWNTHRTCLEYA